MRAWFRRIKSNWNRTDTVVLAPGNIFSPAQTAANFMRFNVSQMQERAWGVLAEVMAAPQVRND